jgi:hypothetical protein
MVDPNGENWGGGAYGALVGGFFEGFFSNNNQWDPTKLENDNKGL